MLEVYYNITKISRYDLLRLRRSLSRATGFLPSGRFIRGISPKGLEGKDGVVVGTANTAHDVAEDMLEYNLASTTIIQQSATHILLACYLKGMLSNKKRLQCGVPHALADQIGCTHLNAIQLA